MGHSGTLVPSLVAWVSRMARLSLRAKLPDLDSMIDDALDVGDSLGEQVVNALESPSSEWPVDSGDSKAGFGYEVDDGNVRLTNTEDYAPIVEARMGKAESTLRGVLSGIASKLDGEVEAGLG